MHICRGVCLIAHLLERCCRWSGSSWRGAGGCGGQTRAQRGTRGLHRRQGRTQALQVAEDQVKHDGDDGGHGDEWGVCSQHFRKPLIFFAENERPEGLKGLVSCQNM